MAGRIPKIEFLQRLRNVPLRALTQRLTSEVWNTPDCEHFKYVLIKNPEHTSHADTRAHVTVRMQTEAQRLRNAGQTVHIYYDNQTGQYEAFKLYSERPEKTVDQPQA